MEQAVNVYMNYMNAAAKVIITLTLNQPNNFYDTSDDEVMDGDAIMIQSQIGVAGVTASALDRQIISSTSGSHEFNQHIDTDDDGNYEDVSCVNGSNKTLTIVSKNQPRVVSPVLGQLSGASPQYIIEFGGLCDPDTTETVVQHQPDTDIVYYLTADGNQTTVSEHQPNIAYSEAEFLDEFEVQGESTEKEILAYRRKGIVQTVRQISSSLANLEECEVVDSEEINVDLEVRPEEDGGGTYDTICPESAVQLQDDDVKESYSQSETVDNSNSEEMNYIQSQLNTKQQHDERLAGRRIVNINLFTQIREMRHSEECHVEDMVCMEEVRKGLHSTFKFECSVCGHQQEIYSCNDGNPVDINNAAVLGITSIGLGAYHLNEFCANLEVPPLSNYLYDKTQKDQQKDWWELAKESAFDALMEEKRLAIPNGDVDSKGNAFILIVCDGSWPKRSYSINFSSLSGCAVIIGVRTNKVIYCDVKDKYCHVFKIAQSKGAQPRTHECNANYVGPSSSMETCIIIEGFQFCEKFGARFKEYIADVEIKK